MSDYRLTTTLVKWLNCFHRHMLDVASGKVTFASVGLICVREPSESETHKR